MSTEVPAVDADVNMDTAEGSSEVRGSLETLCVDTMPDPDGLVRLPVILKKVIKFCRMALAAVAALLSYFA